MDPKHKVEQDAFFQSLAASIDLSLNGNVKPKRNAFILLMAEFGNNANGRVNMVSNADRTEMLNIMKEWIARQEGRYDNSNTTKQ